MAKKEKRKTLLELGDKGIPCIIFHPPNGKKEYSVVANIYPEEAEYLTTNKVKVSMEELSSGPIVIYFDDGQTHDDEPDELIIMDQGRPCEECMIQAVEELKKRKEIRDRLNPQISRE